MFVKVTNGKVDQYPYTVGDLRRDNPNTSFPKNVPEATMAAFGMFPVGYGAAPEYDPLTHRIEHSNMPEREIIGYYTEENAPLPEMVGKPIHSGRWVLTKTVVALTPEQIADRDAGLAKGIREERDRKLAETDWVVVKATETGLPLSTEWTEYRQALRDVTSQEGFPHNVVWPTKP